jgi:hypothetical protein
MAKKQTLASEIGSALGAVAVRAEQLINGTTAPKTTKPIAKRTTAAKHSTPAAAKVLPKVVEITRDAIALQAYLYAEARGFQGGDPHTDWVRAEEELKQRALAAQAQNH